MKVNELLHKLLDVDRNYEIIISEFYATDECDQVLRVDKEIVGHISDDENKKLILVIPNRDGKVGHEDA